MCLGHEIESGLGSLYFGFMTPFAPHGPTDDIHLGPLDNPLESPSLGDYKFPPLSPRNKHGPCAKGQKAQRSMWTRGKGTRHGKYIKRLVIEQDAKKETDPLKHPRKYKVQESHPIATVPAPTHDQRTITTLGRRMLRTGVLHTFTTMPDITPRGTAVEVTSKMINAQFPHPGNLGGKQLFNETYSW